MDNGARARRELERAVGVDCRACRALCEETIELLLRELRADSGSEIVRALTTCAAIADVAAGCLDGEQHVSAALLEFCVDSCEAAAAAAAELLQDEQLRTCGETCRACADTVRALLWAAYED